MDCPHCGKAFHEIKKKIYIADSENIAADKVNGSEFNFISFQLNCSRCPACNRLIIELVQKGFKSIQNGNIPEGYEKHSGHLMEKEIHCEFIHPKAINRKPVPPSVPDYIKSDYVEACMVLPCSPKASAALSRRCLQNIIRDKAGINKNNLSDEIQALIESNNLPSHISETLDAIRHIVNYAAHPNQCKNTGEILEVETGEAEFSLEMLESLIDFYYVLPESNRQRLEALEKRLGVPLKNRKE